MVKRVPGWKELLIAPETSIVDAIKIIDSTGLQIVLVANEQGRLLGTVTDGDVRRGILRGISLQTAVAEIMNPKPLVANAKATQSDIFNLLKKHTLRQLPIVNTDQIVIGISVLTDFLGTNFFENPVVIMAGGLGTRLYPLTKDTPKPMLQIGSKPILEMILENFIVQGFRNFYFSVNYKAEVVKEHFGDGSRFGIQIKYLEEKSRLGTAGSLALLPETPTMPFVVINGDVLTNVNFHQLIDFHYQQSVEATMCVREYEFQVPYGVVSLDKSHHEILNIDEKPTQKFFVNCGIYLLNPEILNLVSKEQLLDMTHLFDRLIKARRPIGAFPLREYWMDIGKLDDLEKANGEVMRGSLGHVE